MKKFLAILLATLMVFSSFALASCDLLESNNDDFDAEDDEKDDKKDDKKDDVQNDDVPNESEKFDGKVTCTEGNDDVETLGEATRADVIESSTDKNEGSELDYAVAKANFEEAVSAMNLENYSLSTKSFEKMVGDNVIETRSYNTEEQVTKDRCWLKMVYEDGSGEIETSDDISGYRWYFDAYASIIKAVVADFNKISCEANNTYTLTSAVVTEFFCFEQGMTVTVRSGKIVIADGLFSQFVFDILVVPQHIENVKLECTTEWNFFDWGTTEVTDEELAQEAQFNAPTTDDMSGNNNFTNTKEDLDAAVSSLDFSNYTVFNEFSAIIIENGVSSSKILEIEDKRIDGNRYYVLQAKGNRNSHGEYEISAGENERNAHNHTCIYEDVTRAIVKDYSKLTYEGNGTYTLNSEVDTLIYMDSTPATSKIYSAKITVESGKIAKIQLEFKITNQILQTVEYECVWEFSSWGTTVISDEEIKDFIDDSASDSDSNEDQIFVSQPEPELELDVNAEINDIA